VPDTESSRSSKFQPWHLPSLVFASIVETKKMPPYRPLLDL
jgi:hypothetical protein